MNLPRDLESYKLLVKQHQKVILVISSILILGLFGLLATSNKATPKVKTVEKIEKPKMTGVHDAVDPRALWVDNLTEELIKLNKKIDSSLNNQYQQNEKRFNDLNEQIKNITESQSSLLNKNQAPLTNSKNAVDPKPKIIPNLIHLQQLVIEDGKKEPATYVTSGSFARAVLLTGVVAETGTEAASSPQPILLRLVNHGIFSKGYKTKQIKEAILIGACHGNISSERALCRLQTLSLMNKDGDIVERPVEGWVIGEDGRPGVKGDVIDKASDVSRMAMLNGILGGMAAFFQNQATSSVYPISPFTGQQNALKGADSLKAATSSGVGNALQKLADYAIKRAEQMSPVIVVGSGRVVDVVFKNGFKLKNEIIGNNPSQPVTSVSTNNLKNNNQQNLELQTNSNINNSNYHDGIKSLENLQAGQGNL